MREHPAQDILLVRAFEELDGSQELLSAASRIRADRAAADAEPAPGEDPARWRLQHRAARLLPELERKLPNLRFVLRVSALRVGLWPVAVLGMLALIAGAAGDPLGPGRRVNLLAVPLLGVFAWNLAAYLGLAARTAWRRSPGRIAPWLAHGWFTRWTHRATTLPGVERQVASAALARFAGYWWPVASSLVAARARVWLHVGAAALAAGLVVGMFVRGLAFEYRATWESTLLAGDTVQSLLDGVLGPAAAVLGTTVPAIGPAAGAGVSARPWLYLYAAATLLYVIVPRGLLALYHLVRARRLASRVEIPIHESYYRRLAGRLRGEACRIDLQPYSYRPDESVVERLRGALNDLYGPRADLRLAQPIAYGGAAGTIPDDARRVLLFNGVQPPESEVHGELVAGSPSAVVAVDLTATYPGSAGDRRREERWRAWQRVMREAGVEALAIEPASSADALIEALGSALDLAGGPPQVRR